jgi:hypothetical protein
MSLVERADLSTWFDKIFQRISSVQEKIHQKEGLFFKKHTYSQEELRNLRDYDAIFSMTETIGENLRQWEKRKRLDEDTQQFYSQKREYVSSRLDRINQMIAERTPTFWERVKGQFEGLHKAIMQNLPTIIQVVITVKEMGLFDKLKLLQPKQGFRRLPAGEK